MDGIRWASEEDALAARRDLSLHGTMFVRRDEHGLAHRVDPTTLQVGPLAAQAPELLTTPSVKARYGEYLSLHGIDPRTILDG